MHDLTDLVRLISKTSWTLPQMRDHAFLAAGLGCGLACDAAVRPVRVTKIHPASNSQVKSSGHYLSALTAS